MDAVILPPDATSGAVRRFPWWIPFSIGVLVILAGLGLLIWPFIAASWLLVVLFGAALFSGGLAALVRQPASAASMVGGLVLVIAGVLSILFAEFTASALVTFVGVALIVMGAFWLVITLSLGARSFAAALPGVLLIAAGIVGLVWPQVALVLAAIVAGFCALAIGAAILWGALRLRGVRLTSSRGDSHLYS